MKRKANEVLSDAVGAVDERYIREYMETLEEEEKEKPRTKQKGRRRRWYRMPFAAAAAIVAAVFLGTAGAAAFVPLIGYFQESRENESRAVVQNFNAIEAAYAVPIRETQECQGVKATLNNAIVEDHYLLLSYTFDWSGLEEARDGSFHTWFLPWFFYISEGENVICCSEYTKGLHTQQYPAGDRDAFTEVTLLYSIDLGERSGEQLLGKELTVRLLYAQGEEGFVSTFVPQACFPDRYWEIGREYKLGEDVITLKGMQETALHVVLFIDCDIPYTFMLSDAQGNDYPLYPNDDNETDGFWFTKPNHVGGGLTLKVVQRMRGTEPSGGNPDDSYEVICEIPIELK